jgi:excisionase family DNA binding protein
MARRAPEQVAFSWSAGKAARPAPSKVARPAQEPRPPSREAQPALPGGISAWLTADAATVYLGFPSRKALYAAVERGQVPAHRLGRRRLRFRLEELDTLLGRLHESDGVH